MSDAIKEPMDLLRVHPIFTFTSDAEYSEDHMSAVARHLWSSAANGGLGATEFTRIFLAAMEPWKPVSGDGRMVKRIANYMFKAYKASVRDDTQAALSSYLAASLPAGDWTFDITNNLRWKAGDFGDSGSCFMNSRPHTLEAMQEAGVHAIRFYADSTGSKGNGRAWIAPTTMNLPVVFNAYGHQLSLVQARLRWLLPGYAMHYCNLCNLGTTSGQVHINSGSGILVGAKETGLAIDLGIYTAREKPTPCYGCGTTHSRAGMYTAFADGEEDIEILLCSRCYSNDWTEDYATGNCYRTTTMVMMDVITPGSRQKDGNAYMGGVIQRMALPRNVAVSPKRCVRCNRLAEDKLGVCIDRHDEPWCYECAYKYAPLECRYCSNYLPADSTVCSCGRTSFRQRRPVDALSTHEG